MSLTPQRRPFEPNLQNPLTAKSADVSETTDYILPKPCSSTETCKSRFAVTAHGHVRKKVEQIKKNTYVKLKSLVHAVKAYRGSKVIAPFIPNIRTRWSCQLHSPAVLRHYPLNRMQGGLQSWSGRFRKISCQYRNSNPGPSSHCIGYPLSRL